MSDRGIPGRVVVMGGVVVMAGLVRRCRAAYRRGLAARGSAPVEDGDRGGEPLAESRGQAQADSARFPGVSVIVPAWNERATIERCIAALATVEYPDWEVVIVAGGSDGTLEAARLAVGRLPPSTVVGAARIIEQRPGGKPAALNAGVLASTKRVVVVLDADGVVRPDWLRALVAPLDGRVRATTGDFLPLRMTAVSRAEQAERIVVYRTKRAPFLQGSGSIAIERPTLAALGGFHLDAPADDWVLDAELRAAEVPIAFAPDALQLTERPATLGEYWANQVRWRRAHLRSISQVPAQFLRDAPTVLRTIHPYAVGWSLLGAATTGLLARLLARPALAEAATAAFGLGLAWSALAPLSTLVEATAYTGDAAWTRDLPTVATLALTDLAAAVVASVTAGRASMAFKGPRATVAMGATGSPPAVP